MDQTSNDYHHDRIRGMSAEDDMMYASPPSSPKRSKIRGTFHVGIVPLLRKADVSKENLFLFSFLPQKRRLFNAMAAVWCEGMDDDRPRVHTTCAFACMYS
eukprot:scaffold61962_cov50-Attheya_sp.AAC.7